MAGAILIHAACINPASTFAKLSTMLDAAILIPAACTNP